MATQITMVEENLSSDEVTEKLGMDPVIWELATIYDLTFSKKVVVRWRKREEPAPIPSPNP